MTFEIIYLIGAFLTAWGFVLEYLTNRDAPHNDCSLGFAITSAICVSVMWPVTLVGIILYLTK